MAFELFSTFGSVFLKGADKTANQLTSLNKKAGGVGAAFKKVGKAALVAGVGIATAATAIGVKAVKAAASFEKGMANVATLLGGDVKKRIVELGKNVTDLMKNTGQSAEVLQDGLYQVISAFGDTDDAMKILEISAKAAAAGNATVTDSVNLLSAVTKGYGDTSAEANKKASDLAFLAVKLGQTTFPELAASMGKVIPLAAELTVSQEDLFTAMATLTGVTGNTAEVSTQLRGIMSSLMKPTTAMAELIEKMGFESGKALIESKGFSKGLTELTEAAEENGFELVDLFGRVEALTATLALTGPQADVWIDKQKQMQDATGATEEAFKVQQGTFSSLMSRLKAIVESLFIEIGNKLIPIIADLATQFVKIIPPLLDFIVPLIEKFVPVIEKLIEKLLPIFLRTLEAFLPLLDPVIDLFLMLIDSALIPLAEALLPIIESSLPLFAELLSGLRPIVEPLITILTTLATVTLAILGETWTDTFGEMTGDFTKFSEIISEKLKKVADFSKDLLSFIDIITGKKTFGGGKFVRKGTILEEAIESFNIITRPGFLGKGKGKEKGEGTLFDKISEIPLPDIPLFKGQDTATYITNINNPKIFNQQDAADLGKLLFNRWQNGGVGKAR